jgi:serine/threonine protein kinase
MSAPSTAVQFLELAYKSGLLDRPHFQAYLERRRAAGPLPEAPRALANRLMRDGLLTRFQVEQLLLGRWRNFILSGKYKVLGPLGSGGMGQVFLCEHQVMRRRVAVKVLPTSRSSNPVSLERFHREARAVAQLHHPNIVSGHDVDRDGKLHFLVMEYVDGSTFHKIVRDRGPMSCLRAAHYVRQAALGLQHAHEAGLVHRDIKPSNLLLERTGTVKILDMGLARFFHDESDDLSKWHLDRPLGTTDYMAPEQALDSHAADIRADIYSLGGTFYFVLTGQSPFQEGTTLEKMISHQIRQPRPIRELRPEVPDGQAAVIDRMMAKEPARRYQTPAEVAEALAPWTQTPIPPPPKEEMPEQDPAAGGPLAVPSSPAPRDEAPSTPTPSHAKTDHGLPPPGSPPSSKPVPAMPAERGSTPVPRSDIRQEATGALLPSSIKPEESNEMDGPRPSPPSPPRKAKDSPPHSHPAAAKRRWLWVTVVAGLLVVAGATSFAVYKLSVGKGPPPGAGQPEGAPPAASDGSPRLRLLVPAYFYPVGEGLVQWDRLIDSPVASATVAILNTSSGPGKIADPNYASVVDRARQKGVTVIGYVSTKYGSRPLRDVKGDVDQWVRLYPEIQGIFFDEQASGSDQVHYYANLYEYVRKERGLALVITNPGTVCAEDYLSRPASDVVCMAEAPKDFNTYRHPGWAGRYPPRCFGALLCNTDAEHMRARILEMGDKRIGYCYVTEGKEPNPWDRLPRYWEREGAAVQEVNERKAP